MADMVSGMKTPFGSVSNLTLPCQPGKFQLLDRPCEYNQDDQVPAVLGTGFQTRLDSVIDYARYSGDHIC